MHRRKNGLLSGNRTKIFVEVNRNKVCLLTSFLSEAESPIKCKRLLSVYWESITRWSRKKSDAWMSTRDKYWKSWAQSKAYAEKWSIQIIDYMIVYLCPISHLSFLKANLILAFYDTYILYSINVTGVGSIRRLIPMVCLGARYFIHLMREKPKG